MSSEGSLGTDAVAFRAVHVPSSFERRPLGAGVAIELRVEDQNLGLLWAGYDNKSAGFINYRNPGVLAKRTAISIEGKLRDAFAAGEEPAAAITAIANELSSRSVVRRFSSFADVSRGTVLDSGFS